MGMSIKDDVIIGEGTKIWYPELSNIYGCKIGNNCNIGALVEIRANVTIGNGCKIQAFAFLPEGINIGNNVFIGPNVTFTNDKYPKAAGDWKSLKTVVEDGASIGASAVILPGIKIGKNVLIGAGSVITKNIPDNELWVGNPARFLRRV
jgi:acetyltransferase-like isoleucine patch superfamily enzyme